MSFGQPLYLLGLFVLPVLAVLYLGEQRRRMRVARAFVSSPLLASVAPRRPGGRRHAPYLLFGLGLVALILAAARPQVPVQRPVRAATVMLANDISSSMTSTDVKPSRLSAAKRAADSFLKRVTSSIQVGSIEFARHAQLLQSPTTQRALTRHAIAQIKPGGGGTAIGDALALALQSIRTAPRLGNRRPPGSVILISDGAANVGVNPITVAAQAKRVHVRIYTISVGTPYGTAQIRRRSGVFTAHVPVDGAELRQIAATSGGRAFSAADSGTVNSIYNDLARVLGHRRVQLRLTGYVAGAGLLLVAVGAALSLLWFARLA